MDRQQDVIRRITAHVIAYRFWRHNQIIDERRELRAMALELKGLKAKAMTARANIGKLDAAYDAFNAQATTHVSDVESLAEQLGGMAEDLTFATTTLGNSVAGSNAGATEKPKEQPSTKPETTDRVALGPHPDQPEGMPDTTEGATWFKTPATTQEVEKPAAATFPYADLEIKLNPAAE